MEQLKRSNYYEGLMIKTGLLEQGKIKQGGFEELYAGHQLQKDIEYTDLFRFLNIQADWENSLNVIEKEEYDRYMASNDESDVMDMRFLSSENFISEFEELYMLDNFEECFVSAKYIDDIENRMIVVVRVGDMDKEFIVDVA